MAKGRRNAKNTSIQARSGASGAAAPAVPPRSRVRTAAQRRRHDATRRQRVWLLAIAAVVALVIASVWFSFMRGGDNDTTGVQAIANLDAPDVHSLLVDPEDPDHILFGNHAGTQESRDGGFSWEAGELRNADAMSLAASPRAPETLYAAGHDVFQVSRDGGATWQPLVHDLPGTDIHGFAQDPADPKRLYALVAGTGVFTSGDGGATWTSLPTQPPGGGMHVGLASSGEALYAATEAGILISRDQGASWEPLPAQPRGGVISLAIPASDPQTLYAGTPDGLAKSIDGGTSWTALGPEGVPALALAVTPADPSRVLFVSDAGAVYRSDDGGTNWRAPQ